MKKILVVIQLVRRGGVELVAINSARNLNKNEYEVSFLLIKPNEHQDAGFLSELKAEGYKFFTMPTSKKGYINKYRFLSGFLKEHKFDIVHSHVMLFSALVLKAARKNGVKVRVAHSHITKWNRKENLSYKFYRFIMRGIINNNATDLVACSQAAGEFLYGENAFSKRGTVIPNGIDVEEFAYSKETRAKKRKELEIADDTLLLGHVGTIYRIKNQVFIVEILNELLQKNLNAKLILSGEKVDTAPVADLAAKLGISDNVEMLGQRSDVKELLQAFDIMIFPSLHEGLPVSLIEAQASKLPCLISDTVTREVKFNDNVEFASLTEPASAWAEKALKLLEKNRYEISIERLACEYDLDAVTNALGNIYCK